VVVIGLTPREGDAFQPAVLAKVQRITTALLDTPGIVKTNILSFSARRAKRIVGTADGMEVLPLMETVPQTGQALEALRQAVRANLVYGNVLISRDERTAAILADFKEPEAGFQSLMTTIRRLLTRERDASVDITVGGLPVFLAQLEGYSQRMG